MVSRPGQLLSAEELLDEVWSRASVSPQVLTNAIAEIRRALRSGDAHHFIETEYGRGYRFSGPLEPAGAEPPGLVEWGDTSGAESTGSLSEASGLPRSATGSVSNPYFVGREPELEQLFEAWTRSLDGERQILFVDGEPGIGKTSLVDAFLDRLSTQPRPPVVVKCRCLRQHGELEPYRPILEGLEALAGRFELASLLESHAPTWAVQLPWLYSAERLSGLRQSLVGIGVARMLREGARLLEVLASATPIVVVLEDLQWCDLATLDLVATVAQRTHPANVVLIGTYRPAEAVLLQHPLRTAIRDLSAHGQCSELHLGGLKLQNIRAYLNRRFDSSEAVDRFAGHLEERTGGHALFLCAAMDYLVREGAIRRKGRGWEVSARSLELQGRLPDDVRAVIRGELDLIREPVMVVLEAASVVQEEFTTEEVCAATGSSTSEVEDALESLVVEGVFVCQVSEANWPDGTVTHRYRFLHELYRETILERIPPARLRELHRLIGERLERGWDASVSRIADRLVDHFEAAGDEKRVIDYLEMAAGNAVGRYRLSAAVDHLQRLLEMASEQTEDTRDPRREFAWWIGIGNAETALKGYGPTARSNYERSFELASELEDERLMIRAQMGRSLNAVFNLEPQGPPMMDALVAMVKKGHPELATAAHFYRAHAHLMIEGDFVRAWQEIEAAGASKPEPGIPAGIDLQGAILATSGTILMFLGRAQEARSKLAEAIERSGAHGASDQLRAHYCAAEAMAFLGDDEAALVQARKAVQIVESNELWVGACGLIRAWTDPELEDRERLEIMQEAHERRSQAGEHWTSSLFLSWMARLELRLGRPEEAERLIEDALAVPERNFSAEVHRVRGEIALASNGRSSEAGRSAREAAVGHFRKAVDIASAQGSRLFEAKARASLERLEKG